MPDLTCYRLRAPGGGEIGDFDEAFEGSDLARFEQRGPIRLGEASLKLYYTRNHPHPPAWAGLINRVFDEDIPFPPMSGAAAVLVVRCPPPRQNIYLAFTFGYGWQLLRPEVYERSFGLRTALNIIYEGDTGSGDLDAARLRSVDAKRIGPALLRSRHQVAGVAVLEELQVDIRRDLLSGLTGQPMDAEAWGTRVTGRDSLHLHQASLSDLPATCERILDAHEGTSYRARFSFIDDFTIVTDPISRTFLQEEVLASLQVGNPPDLDLAPPELVEWEKVSGFRYHTERGVKPVTRVEMRLRDYLATLEKKSMTESLTVDKLQSHYIWAVDGDGRDIQKWSPWRCLYGQLVHAGQTYVLEDGDFYVVSDDYLAALDSDIRALSTCSRTLPPWIATDHEDEYNSKAAASSDSYLLLDKKTVRIGAHTNQVEICDILSDDGMLIHVKRRRDGSASLSHLFAQGVNSADLIVASPEFQDLTTEQIKKQEAIKAVEAGDPSLAGRFQIFDAPRVAARNYEVVYAIFANWSKGGFETLPFFSKITLRNAVDDLRRLGFKATVMQIEGATV